MCQREPSSTEAPGDPGSKGDLAPCTSSTSEGVCLGQTNVDVRHKWSKSSRSPMARHGPDFSVVRKTSNDARTQARFERLRIRFECKHQSTSSASTAVPAT